MHTVTDWSNKMKGSLWGILCECFNTKNYFLAIILSWVWLFSVILLACSSVKTPDKEYSSNIKIKWFKQVSTSAVTEEKDIPVVSADESTKLDSLESDNQRVIAVHYVLEESSGYMEPTLRILAILHTVISFFCIIGYYCLKVRETEQCYFFLLPPNFFIYRVV